MSDSINQESSGRPESKKRKRQHVWQDFEKLAQDYPDFLEAWNKLKKEKGPLSSVVTQEFNIAWTRALMHSHFGIALPSLPLDRLCPPVPNRYAYVEWIQNHLLPLLSTENDYFFSAKPLHYRGMDIGTGASCIYPLLFCHGDFRRYSMIGTEIDAQSAESARKNVEANGLESQIQVQLVKPISIQLQEGEHAPTNDSSFGPIRQAHNVLPLDFVMVNPPFFDTTEEVDTRADGRDRSSMTLYEGRYPGGEFSFICDMIRDSLVLRNQVGWYSCMCGKKITYTKLKHVLHHLVGPGHVQSMEFGPGHQTRWFLAWTFRCPKMTSPAARVVGGGTCDFEVEIEESTSNAVDEVVSRICAYCEWLSGWDLTAVVTKNGPDNKVFIHETSVPSVDVCVDGKDELPKRVLDGIELDWDANSFLPAEGHFGIDICVSQKQSEGPSTVSVSLKCYRHSNRGSKAVEKIRAQLHGEISRSNRRWRRMLKRQQHAKDDAPPQDESK